jgi:regulator of sigma E protease
VIFQILLGAVSIVLMFLLLIGPHEAGHFGFAKLFRLRVYEFAIGMGPRLWSITRGGTLYALRAIPVGGYVRLGGMEPENYAEPDGFHKKPAWQRILVLLGGPAVNFLMAALIMTGLFMTHLNSDPGKVGTVVTNPPSPAYAQCIRPNDSIVAIDGKPIARPEDIRNEVTSRNGQPVEVTVRHPNGRTDTLTIQPVYSAENGRYIIGVATEPVVGPLTAITEGFKWPFQTMGFIAAGIYALASGQIPGGVFGPQGATGAIGIAAITYSAARAGIEYFLGVAAVLSVALGMANLLPLPALDGGRIVVVLLEALRRRPFDREKEMAVQRWGLAAILALAVLIAYFDIQRIANNQFPGLR